MMLILRAASFLFVVLRSHAARADRNDGIADAVALAEAPPSVSGERPGVETDDTTMALPSGPTKEDSPTLGGAEGATPPMEAVAPSSTLEPTAPLAASHTASPTPEVREEEDPQDLKQGPGEAAVKPPSAGAPGGGSGAGVHAEHFKKTVAHSEQIKAAVDRVHEKTQVAKEAAVAVKDSFGKYQGTISDLKKQLNSVDDVAHKFEDELWERLARDESTRLQPFEEYNKQFGDVEGVEEADEPTVGASPKSLASEHAAADLSFLQSGHHARHSSSNESASATGGNRFEKSVQQSEQIKVAVGKVKEKVEVARQAAAKVKQGFEDYKGKVVEVRNQLNEVDKKQHEYHEKLLNHYDGQEGDRMSAFENPPSLESEGLEDSSNATAKESGLLQSRARGQLSKEHVSVNVGGSFHAARI